MAAQVETNTGGTPKAMSAHNGYCSEDNLEELERLGIRGYVVTGRQKHGTASATGKGAGRGGTRVQGMPRRLKQGGHRSRYRLRKQTVEPVFGQIKGARGEIAITPSPRGMVCRRGRNRSKPPYFISSGFSALE